MLPGLPDTYSRRRLMRDRRPDDLGHTPRTTPLEEWHRYSHPSFTERMRTRLRNHCQEDHQSWPAKGRYTRYIAEPTRRWRLDVCNADVRALGAIHDQTQLPRLGL